MDLAKRGMDIVGKCTLLDVKKLSRESLFFSSILPYLRFPEGKIFALSEWII